MKEEFQFITNSQIFHLNMFQSFTIHFHGLLDWPMENYFLQVGSKNYFPKCYKM
jgi:hypothetical protein